MSRRTTKPRKLSAPPRMVLGGHAKGEELKRGKVLAAAALQDIPLFDALAELFYEQDMYVALDFVAADGMSTETYKLHAALAEGFGEPYDTLATELAFAAFMLGVAMMLPRGLASVQTEKTEATKDGAHALLQQTSR